MKECYRCEVLYPDLNEQCKLCKKAITTYFPRKTDKYYPILKKYNIEAILGVGRYAIVYKVRHLELNLTRALKILHSDRTRFIDRARFIQEAKILSKLDHINIVKIHDSNLLEESEHSHSEKSFLRPYYIMDFIVGKTLGDILCSVEQVSIKSALQIGAQIASGLAYAHKNGIIHRDIHPENILITQSATGRDMVKIIDFGVAKYKEGTFNGWSTTLGAERFLGHPEYMCPEIASGQVADASTDEYSLGCILYEMLIGELPFTGKTEVDINRKKALIEAPSIRNKATQRLKDSTEFTALEQLIQRMLNRKSFLRFNNMYEIERILRRCAQESQSLVVFCNAKEDNSLLNELKKHMFSLFESLKISSWNSSEIPAGTNFEREIINAVSNGDVLILLLSSDFFNSSFYLNKEIWKIILGKIDNYYTSVLPIILRPTEIPSDIANLHCLPSNRESLIGLRSRDKIWLEVVEHIRRNIQKIEPTHPADAVTLLNK